MYVSNLQIVFFKFFATLPAAKGYDLHLEQLIIEAGESPEEARKLTRIVGLVKDKPPETEEEWDEFLNVWEGEAQ